MALLLLLLLLPVCICIFTANLKSISCFAESGYNANIYDYLGQFHSRRMALPAFYWLPQNCVLRTVALLTFLWLPFPSSPPPSPLLLRLENDAKVLPLHATWRMRNIYLCQLSLIAVQCQLRCQFTFIPFPFIPLWHIPSVVFAMFTYVSFPSGLVEHIRPIWRPISALRFSERATNCRWDWQPVQLICLSVCLPLFLSASLLACHLSVCPSVSLVLPARREYLNCGIFVAFEVKVFAFDFGYKVDSTSPPFPPPFSLHRATCAKTLPASLSDFLRWHWTHLRASLLLSSVSSVSVRLSVCIDVCLRVRHLLLAFQFATFNSIYFQFINCLQHELASLLCCIPNKVFHCVLGF